MAEYPIEVVNFGRPGFDAHVTVIEELNRVQKDLLFRLPPERCQSWAAPYDFDSLSTDRVWEILARYRRECRGFHPFVIALAHGELASSKYGNLFGSHRASDGLAAFTTNDWNEVFAPPPIEAFIAYYLVRYAISFISPDIKNHDDTRDCFFDRKLEKDAIKLSMQSGKICDPCRSILSQHIDANTYQSLLTLIYLVRDWSSGSRTTMNPKLFIVHGQDEGTKWEVKNYFQNTLHLPEPIVLHEQPNQGRTIIEKFEEVAAGADGAVILLTPDDTYVDPDGNAELRRARQNVILELGYFLHHFGRRSGKVLLLYKKPLDIPTDLSGVVYINISDGVASASEEIRRELGIA